MKVTFAKKACALMLTVIMVFSMLPINVFAQEGGLAPDNNIEQETETTLITQSVSSAQQLEEALASDADKIVITADFEIDRTYYIVRDVIICAEEAHTLTRKLDFAGDFFVIGENAEGVACEDRVKLTVGTKDTENEDMLTFEGNKDNMEVSVVGTVFFVCAQGQADLCPDVTVQNFKKTGNDRALSENHELSNNPSNVGGAVGIIAGGGVMNIYGGKYVNNGVEESGLYGGAFFNHSTLNVYDGLFDGNYALRAGAFYNYRTMYLYKGTIQNNKGISTDSTSSLGGAIYLPSSSGAKLYVGGNEKTDEIQVVFKNNTAHTAGAISTSGELVIRNTLFEANTSLSSAAAVYASGTFASVKGYDCIFKSNTATDNGGAVYVKSPAPVYFRDTVFEGNSAVNGGVAFAEGGSLELNFVALKQNAATGSGGAVYMSDAASVVMNEVLADLNSAATHGGVLYSGEGDLKAYNSTFKNNTALTGSAMRFYTSASADFYNCVFEKNTCADATTGNAGALFVYTGGTKVSLNTCTFTENASKGLGGAILVSGKSVLDLYNITAEGNSALKGGFMYETAATTVVNISGLTVSKNTATEGGAIIWGNTTNAKLNINKNNYLDKDATGELDEAYWSTAIYNKLTVTETDAQIPAHDEYDQPDFDTTGLPDVKTSKQLELALNAGFEKIRILKSFEIDRTYYVTKSTEIFSDSAVTLTRKADFVGDIFVVGEDKNAVATEEKVTLSLGKSDSDASDMLIIDGNGDNMAEGAEVEGSAIFVCSKGIVNLYPNLTVTNCKKVKNSRTANEAHGVSYPDLVGGAVGILAKDSAMNIYGGKYINNSANMSGDSIYGGAFYNFGTIKVYGGEFSNNSANRAGVFYNYRTLYIYSAVIENNSAKLGGAIYLPASTGALLYLGSEKENIKSDVLFKGNTAENNGGAIYLSGRMTAFDTVFEENSANNGGAIYGAGNYKTISLTNVEFIKNSAVTSAGAVYLEGQSSFADKFELNAKDTVFKENSAGAKGTVCLTGTRACFEDVLFEKNTADTVGAIYAEENSKIEMNKVTAIQNSATGSGGFGYFSDTEANLYNSIFEKNSASSGGAISLSTGAAAGIYNCQFKENSATSLNGGALDIYTQGTEVLIHSCAFEKNTAANYGGAIRVTSSTPVKMYKITATENSAAQGGFLYETKAGSVVTIAGLTVSKNTAQNGGNIIWGNTLNATLNIDKTQYTDLETDTLDESYWASAIEGNLTVNSVSEKIPNYADFGNEEPGGMWDATDVKSADELESAINSGKTEIRVIASFDLDRTYYITNNVTIFATAPVTLKRAADFAGDIFVVGENAEKVPCAEEVSLTIGIPTSQTENLFVIDGNASKMTVDVNGTVFFVCANGNVNLYENLTVKNCKKVSNERTLEEVHGVSYPDLVGGAVGILAKDSSMNIYGGTYTNNRTNESGDSIYGGAFYNFGVMNVYGGTYTKNSAARAGVFYNYRTLNLYKAEISQNAAKTSGGAIYMPASTGSFLYIGEEKEGIESEVIFSENTAETSGGAIYANNKITVKNAVFEKNSTKNGGAIITNGAKIELSESEFKENSATNGGAIYVSENAKANIGAAVFENNSATNGGALYVKTAQIELNGTQLFENSAKNGGAAYISGTKDIVIKGISAEKNTAEESGAAIFATESGISIFESSFKGGTAQNGGAIALENACEVQIVKTEFEGNAAENGGGSLYLNTPDVKVLVHSCNFTGNSASQGAAAFVSGGAQLKLFNASLTQNTAAYGAVLYLSGEGSRAYLNGITVSQNSALTDGELAYGDCVKAVLTINKANFTDQKTSPLDESYWARVISGELEILDTDEKIPGYAEVGNESFGYMWDARDAKSADELAAALSEGAEHIRITADFVLDRTFTIEKDAVIFSTKPHKITRDENFGGTIFVISGENTVFGIGNSTSQTQDLLTIDSNRDNMKVEVTGPILSVLAGASAELFENLTVTSASLTPLQSAGSLRIEGGKYINNTSKEDGAVLICEGSALINGGIFSKNLATNGGVISNKGTLVINGGTFTENSAENGGVIHNTGTLEIKSGEFSVNSAKCGGAIYNAGALEILSAKFILNTAENNGGAVASETSFTLNGAQFNQNRATLGGAIYVESEAHLVAENTAFVENMAEKGGAIASNGATLVISAGFEANTATLGGAVYAENSGLSLGGSTSIYDSASENGGMIYSVNSTVDLTDCTVTLASAKCGGAIYVEGSTALFNSTEFTSNTADIGGAVYTKGADASFENCTFTENSAENGGAVYSDSEIKIDGGVFEKNQAAKNGGALALIKGASLLLDGAEFKNNTAENGGAVFLSDAAYQIKNSTFKKNTVDNGGAVCITEDSEGQIEQNVFEGNEAALGGAVYIKTDTTKSVLNTNTFTSNTANKGAAIYIGEFGKTEIYNTTARENSAEQGAVLYIAGAPNSVIFNGSVVSSNTAKAGTLIYGESKKAILKIRKAAHIDEDAQTSLDQSYWEKAIAGAVSVVEIDTPAPDFGAGATEVGTADELEDAIKANKKLIRITADFAIDRTYFITSDITIFSLEPHTLTRAEDFGGDMFVVGENEKGEKAYFDSRVVKLTLGNPVSDKNDLLTIDGNSENMKTEVVGSVIFVSYGAKADLYHNLTVKNCFKQGNERAHVAEYKISRPNRIGGPVAVIASGMLTVYGGKYISNKVNIEDSSTEEGRNSSIGGVFYNNSNLIIKGGHFEDNEGARGGIIYNYKTVKIFAGTFVNNRATKYAAIYYAPSSPTAQLIMGNSEENGEKLLVKDNTSKNNGGVIYSSHFSAVVILGNAVFKNNQTTSGNGGVINVIGALTVKNAEFIGNKAYSSGGAVYLSRSDNDEITRLMHFEGCTFVSNSAKTGGVIGVSSAAADTFKKGSVVTVKNCEFRENTASSSGGAVFLDNLTDFKVEDSTFVSNSAKGEAGAMYIIGKSDVEIKNTEFIGNTSSSHGGAISIRSAYLDIDGGIFKGNSAKNNAGAIYLSYTSAEDINSHVTVNNSEFIENSAKNGGSIYATRRAIEEKAVLLNVKNTSFEKNSAVDLGGAVLLTAGIKTYFADVDFKENTAKSSGGALQIGSNSMFELDKATFSKNTSGNGGAINLASGAVAVLNSVNATENAADSYGGFVYSEGGTLRLYNSKINNNKAYSGGAMYLFTDAVTGIYSTEFDGNTTFLSESGSTGNGGALFVYTGGKETVIHSSHFKNNKSTGLGGGMYVSGVSAVKIYNATAESNSAEKGGFIYETKAGTVMDVIGLTVSQNSAVSGGAIIWGNTANAVMNIDKSKYKDKQNSNLNSSYWQSAIEGKLTVNDVSKAVAEFDPYEGKEETVKPPATKKPVSVEDVFSLAQKSSDADINEDYNKLKKLDNSSNFMSRATAKYPKINGKTVMVDTFVYPTRGTADNGIVGLGILLYQSLLYKKQNPSEEVYIDISSYRFSVQSAVNINRNSRYFGYMRDLKGENYDEYGFVKLSYLLITAAKMGIHVNVIGQLDAYPTSSSSPDFYDYFTQQLSDPCDPDYAKGKVIGDYLDFNFCYWTLDLKGGTDMMHTKMATVSHYLDKDGKAHKNAVWSSSSNLDGVKANGQNANWKLQTASIVTNHDEIYRVATNYLRLISDLCGQEQVIEFQHIVNHRSTEQIALINQGRADEIAKDEQLVYLGTPNDDVFELYFTPFGGSRVAWDEVNNPYCKYIREMYESEDYIIFSWNSAEYSGGFVLGQQIEQMIIKAFHDNKNAKNKIYSYMEGFDATTFDDLVVGKDIGYKSFFEKPFGTVHNKDVQLSYVKDGQRYFVTLLNSLNLHSGSMSYQSNFMLVVKEKSCAENGVFSTIARYTASGDLAAHSYGELQTVEATDSKHGYTYRECIYCGEKKECGTLHKAGGWIVDKKATHDEAGLRHKECTICGDVVKSEEIERTTLSFDTEKFTGKDFSEKSSITVSSTKVPLTIEACVRIPKSFGGRSGVIVGNYSESGNGIINLEGVEKGRIKLYIKNGSSIFRHTFLTDIRSNEPVSIAVTLSSGKARLYVNGELKETAAYSIKLPSKLEKLRVARDNRKDNSQYFKGRLYCVNLFSTVRTASQIKEDALLVCPETAGLIYSRYFSDEKIKAEPKAVTLTSQSFKASERNRLKTYLTSAPKTIEATIALSPSVSSRGGVIFGNYKDSYTSPLNLEIDTNGRVKLYFKNNGERFSHTFAPDIRRSSGTAHIAVTLSGKTATLFVDGVNKESVTFPLEIPAATKNFCVGGDNRDGNSQYFKGKIYNVNVFSDVRTDSEIKNDVRVVASNAKGLIYSAYMMSDENGISGQKVTLKGQTFKAGTLFAVPETFKSVPKTIEAVISLPTSVSSRGGVIFGNYNESYKAPLNLEIDTKGRVKLYFKRSGEKVSHTFDTDIRSDSGAVHIAVTVSGKKATLYVNGSKAETATLKAYLPAATKNFCIGGDNREGNEQYFKGKIYSVNVFSDVRTAAEIEKDAIVVTDKAASVLYSGYFYDTNCNLGAAKDHVESSVKTKRKLTDDLCGIQYTECTVCKKILKVKELKEDYRELNSVDYSVYTGKTFESKEDIVAVSKSVSGKSFTFEAMIELSPKISERAGAILGNYDGGDGDQINVEAYTDGKIRLYYKVDGTAYTKVFSPDIRAKGKTHIALTVSDKTVNLYVNGKHAETYTAKVSLADKIENLKIGGDNRQDGGLFGGRIYSAHLFNGVRSASQIASDMLVVSNTKPKAVYSGFYNM